MNWDGMEPGIVVDQYQIVERIGRGGMAEVWSARDWRLNRMVAIKTVVRSISEKDKDSLELLRQEAQTIAQMEHPHILPIYDFGEFESQFYIVMRYVTGGSLDDLLRLGALPMQDGLRLAESIAHALDYAHQHDVVHLDLKPPNVLLDSNQSPYLADFGLATVLDNDGKANNPGFGTVLYMAPEQFASDQVDARADIYSFSVMLFHIFTGQLPFDSEEALAFRQLSAQEELPPLHSFNPEIPPAFTEILRRGTSQNPADRPDSAMEIVGDLRAAYVASFGPARVGNGEPAGISVNEFAASYSTPSTTRQIRPGVDAALLEAMDIYSRARHNWANGNGRFLLGMTHFMLMSGYYMQAEWHGLRLDLAGKQMLLRGALEYEHDVEYWWNTLDDDSRRWVCLHAVQSSSAATRVRALYRLETLPDGEREQIPRLVAQALQIETDQAARIAALRVLGTRIFLMKAAPRYDVKSDFRGRVLTTETRRGIQERPATLWRPVAYTPDIDTLIAETALDAEFPRVAELAARTIGRIRSEVAAAYIAQAQREGRPGALRALALIRDEAPSLPGLVSLTGRFYAWAANTLRRATQHPVRLLSRQLAALLGAWLGMGFNVYMLFRPEFFQHQRWANAVAIGMFFGVIGGFVPLVADELPTRLRGFWPAWSRLLVSLLLGTLWASLAWWAYSWFFLNLQAGLGVVLVGGFGWALGYALTAAFELRSLAAIPLTVLLTYLPVYVTFQVGWMGESVGPVAAYTIQESLIYFEQSSPEQVYSVGLPLVILMTFGGYLSLLIEDFRYGAAKLRIRQRPTVRGKFSDLVIDTIDISTRRLPSPPSDEPHG